MRIDQIGWPRETLAALVEASAAINGTLDLDAALLAIAHSAAQVMQAEASSVLLLDPTRRKLVFRAATGSSGPQLVGESFDADLGIAGKVVRTAAPVLVADVADEPSFFRGIDERSHFVTRSLIAAPLIKQGQVIGVVEVLNKRTAEPFNRQDVELLQVFANLAASGATNAAAHQRLREQNRALAAGQNAAVAIIGNSPALQSVLELCARVAGSTATVLVLGETGTGKELLSRYLHLHSPRAAGPFVALHCAALPEPLLESELFGHEKGAFTGAVAQKPGRFELAAGGTLFLDEIGELSPAIQVKLLRVLQEREFVRVGGTRTLTCDARIIAATHRDLHQEVQEGRFREDLYYRLNVFPIVSPPLRERREDIPLLIEHLVRLSAGQLGVALPTVADEAMAHLLGYAWPGNIRELRNVLERAVLLSERGMIEARHLPREIVGEVREPAGDRREMSLWGYEKALIVKALKETGWNQTRAARQLGISRDNLRYRLKKFKIDKPAT